MIMNPWILERNCSLLPGRPDVIVNHSRSERDAVTPAPADAVSIALVKLLRGITSRSSHRRNRPSGSILPAKLAQFLAAINKPPGQPGPRAKMAEQGSVVHPGPTGPEGENGGTRIGGSSVGKSPGSGSGSGTGSTTNCETARVTSAGGAVTRVFIALRLNFCSSDSQKAEILYDLYFRMMYLLAVEMGVQHRTKGTVPANDSRASIPSCICNGAVSVDRSSLRRHWRDLPGAKRTRGY